NRTEGARDGYVDRRPDECGTDDLQVGGIEEGGDVGYPDLFHMGPFLSVLRNHHTCRRIQTQDARRLRLNEPVLDGEGDRSDRAVSTHGKTAGRFDEEDRNIAVFPG